MAIDLTIPANDRLVRYVASLGQTDFDYDFPLLDVSDLDVWRFRAGVEQILLLDQDYSVVDAGQQNGGHIVLLAAALAGDIFAIDGGRTIERMTALQPGPRSFEGINDELDRMAVMLQELRRDVGRAVRLSPTDVEAAIRLPRLDERAGKSLQFDAQGRAMPGLSGDDISAARDTAVASATQSTSSATQSVASASQASASAAQSVDSASQSSTSAMQAEQARDASIAASEHMAWSFDFDSSIVEADPGVGKFRFDQADFSAAGWLYISEHSAQGDLSGLMEIWDDSTSILKAQVLIKDPLFPTNWLEFYITGQVVDAGSWRKMPISPISQNGAILNGTSTLLRVQRKW